MEFGLFSNNRRPTRSLGEAWDEDIFEAVTADRLGFHEIWFSEHQTPGRTDHRQGRRRRPSASAWARACARSATTIRCRLRSKPTPPIS